MQQTASLYNLLVFKMLPKASFIFALKVNEPEGTCSLFNRTKFMATAATVAPV
jgi:hypothetical protein